MEIEGHPTQDIVDELQRRGAARSQPVEAQPGIWLFIPDTAFDTDIDEPPTT